MQAAAQPAPSQGQARGESLLSRPASKSFFCQLLLGVTGPGRPSPLPAPLHEDKKRRPTRSSGCAKPDWSEAVATGAQAPQPRSRSLIRQGNDLERPYGASDELRPIPESRSLIRQGNDLDRRPPKSLRQKDLGCKNLKPLFSRTNVQRFRGVKIDKIMPQILSTYKLATYLKPPPIFPVF